MIWMIPRSAACWYPSSVHQFSQTPFKFSTVILHLVAVQYANVFMSFFHLYAKLVVLCTWCAQNRLREQFEKVISSNWTLDVSINMEKCCPLRVMFDVWCFCCKVFHYAEYIHVIIIFIASWICSACCCCFFFFKCGVSNYKKEKRKKEKLSLHSYMYKICVYLLDILFCGVLAITVILFRTLLKSQCFQPFVLSCIIPMWYVSPCNSFHFHLVIALIVRKYTVRITYFLLIQGII